MGITAASLTFLDLCGDFCFVELDKTNSADSLDILTLHFPWLLLSPLELRKVFLGNSKWGTDVFFGAEKGQFVIIRVGSLTLYRC